MNNILIIAHEPLASALRSAALHARPDAAPRIAALDVPANEAPDVTLVAVQKLMQSKPTAGHTGTLVLSDIVGATPCNVAQQLVNSGIQPKVKCIAGASLPMLLRAITYWDESLAVMAEKALAGASLGAVELN